MTNKEKQTKFEAKGWKFSFFMSGRGVQATKGNRKITAISLTALFKKLS